MNIGKEIKKIRELRSYTMDQLIQKLKEEGSDINKSTLSRIENDERQKIDAGLLISLSHVLKYNFLASLGLQNKMFIDDIVDTNNVQLPVYGKASAGNGYLNMENVLRKETISIFPGEKMPQGAFIVEVSGESMYPTILDGDLVIVNPNCNDLNLNNKVCIVKYDNQVFIKRVSIKKDFVFLMSDNPDRVKYSDIIISKERCEDFFCYGIVIERRTKF